MNKLNIKTLVTLVTLGTFASCATNEFDAQIEKAYADVVIAANAPKVYADIDCPLGCTAKVYLPTDQITLQRAKGNVEAFTDGLVGVVSALTPLGLAREARKLTTDVASVIASSAGDTISDSYNSADQANTSSTVETNETNETVSGIKAGGNVDQSQQNPSSSSASTVTSTEDSSGSGNSESTQVLPEVPEVTEVPVVVPEVPEVTEVSVVTEVPEV